MAMPRCAWAGAWISPKRKGGVAGWWQLRHGPVHIFVCDCGAFVIWQTNWQQDVRSDSRSKRQGAFERVFWPGGGGLRGQALLAASTACRRLCMRVIPEASSPERERWSELNWIGAKWSGARDRRRRRCVGVPISCRCLCACVCVCVCLRHVAHFIFQVINQFSAPLKMKTKNERAALKLTLLSRRGFQELRLASKSRSWVAGRLALGSGIREWGPGGNSWRTWAERKLKSLNQKIPKNTMDAEWSEQEWSEANGKVNICLRGWSIADVLDLDGWMVSLQLEL